MPLQSTSGAASYDAFGGGVAAVPKYIEEYFSTFLYTGTGSAQTITNGIDLSTKGGLVWIKSRSATYTHRLFDTNRGATKFLVSNDTLAEDTNASTLTAFTSSGFSVGASTAVGENGTTYASWSWAKAPKFFDVVTYTGAGSGTTVSHNLGSTPGCVIVKATSGVDGWFVYHKDLLSAPPTNRYLKLNTTDATAFLSNWISVSDTTITFPTAYGPTASSGTSYVAYLFAHDAGGFGLTGTDNVISCGSYTGNGSATGPVVTLGYEPQWLMVKRTDSTGDWNLIDNMRGFVVGGTDAELNPNLSSAESTGTFVSPNATGFQLNTTNAGYNANTAAYIYIAIRRGPMKVPTSGTSVFYPQAIAQADSPDSSGVPFPPDLVNMFSRNGTDRTSEYDLFQFADRLRGLGTPANTQSTMGPTLISSSTAAELSASSYIQLKADSQNITRGTGWNSANYGNWISYFWRRAPSFFDEVCWTSDDTTQVLNHNLTVAPELIIRKPRSIADEWAVGFDFQASSYKKMALNTTAAQTSYGSYSSGPFPGKPTATQFTDQGSGSGRTFVAYLFATCAGVSKVGSYTGTATTKQVDCGFTGGARFVLIKRTDSTGDWYVWDSARGIVSGNDPYLLLNSTAAEVTNTDYIDTYSAGFEISSTAPAAINASGGTYIFLAIA